MNDWRDTWREDPAIARRRIQFLHAVLAGGDEPPAGVDNDESTSAVISNAATEAVTTTVATTTTTTTTTSPPPPAIDVYFPVELMRLIVSYLPRPRLPYYHVRVLGSVDYDPSPVYLIVLWNETLQSLKEKYRKQIYHRNPIYQDFCHVNIQPGDNSFANYRPMRPDYEWVSYYNVPPGGELELRCLPPMGQPGLFV